MIKMETELSILIAKIVSIIYLSAALGWFFSRDYYRKILNDMFNNAGLSYLAGFLTVIIGLLIVNYHNIWESNWTVLITIIGWVALIKGVFIIAFPKFVHNYSQSIFKGTGFKIFPFVAIVIGLIFGYFGFIA